MVQPSDTSSLAPNPSQVQPSLDRAPDGPRSLLFGTIRNKIIVPFLFVTLVVTMLGTYIVTRLLATNAQDRLTNQLLEVSRATSDNMVKWEQNHLETLRLTVFAVGLPEAIQERDVEPLNLALTALVANQNAYMLLAITPDGTVLTDARQGNTSIETGVLAGQDMSHVFAVQQVLAGAQDEHGDKYAEILELNGELVLMTVAPARNHDGELVGAVAVATPIKEILTDTKANVLADLILYEPGGKALYTTFVLVGDTNIESLNISPELYQTALRDAESATSLQAMMINRREYQAAFVPLKIRGRQLGVLGVAYPASLVSSLITTNRSGMTVLFSVIAGLVVILGYIIAANLSTPIRQLARTAQAVRAGDLNQQSGVRTADEIGILGRVFDDMTVRLGEQTETLKRLYEEQEKEAAYLAAVIASSADGTVVVAMDGAITRLNPVASVIIRHSQAEWLDILSEVMNRLLHGESGDQRVEVDSSWFDVVAAPIRNTRNEEIGVVITLRDVTEQVLTDRMRTAFILQMSHELYTPLTAFKGYAELAYKVLENVDTRARDFLPLAIHNAGVLNRMITEMLDVGQMIRGGFEITPGYVDLSDLVDELVMEKQDQVANLGLSIEAHLKPDLPVYADKDRLVWATTQLINNAMNYTQQGGRIGVYTARKDSYAVLRVMDTGVGIAPHERPHIFEQFYRGQPVANDGSVIDVRGTGLGLFIVDQVVRAHRGRIDVASQVGKGAQFTIWLPIAETAMEAGGGGTIEFID